MRTIGTPIQAILLGSYTTASMNFITLNKAYSIFPKQNLVDHKYYPFRPLNDNFGSLLAEYQSQGWTSRDMVWPDLTNDPLHQIKRRRRVGDQLSLVIQLEKSGFEKPPTPDFVIEHAQFIVRERSSHLKE